MNVKTRKIRLLIGLLCIGLIGMTILGFALIRYKDKFKKYTYYFIERTFRVYTRNQDGVKFITSKSRLDDCEPVAFVSLWLDKRNVDLPIIFYMYYKGGVFEHEESPVYGRGSFTIELQSLSFKLNTCSTNATYKLYIGDNLLSSTKCKDNTITFNNLGQIYSGTGDYRFYVKKTFKITSDNDDFTDWVGNVKDVDIKAWAYLDKKEFKFKAKYSYADKSVYRYEDLEYATPDVIVNKYPFIKYDDKTKEFIIKKGIYNINEDVIIPHGHYLVLEPGVVLVMSKDKNFVSYSPIKAVGTLQDPIIVKPKDNSEAWGVFGVVGDYTFKEVHLSYVQFYGGNETHINNAYLSGMVSLYRVNKAYIDHCQFFDAHADDALNVKNSWVELSYSYFKDNFADAFDSDFLTGKVHNNLFVDNGNDSIDTSGSNLLIYFNKIVNSGDKCMSFGENSNNVAINNILYSCHIGVESKDGSRPTVLNNIFKANNIAVNTYKKKYFYNSPYPKVAYNIFKDNKEQITFKNTFKGEKLKDDESKIDLISNIFDVDSFISDNYCNNCKNNKIIKSFEQNRIKSNERIDGSVCNLYKKIWSNKSICNNTYIGLIDNFEVFNVDGR